jgi:hypothetical protein
LGGAATDLGVDRVTMFDDGGDELAGQCRRGLVALLIGQMPLQDGVCRPLPEVRFEDRREGEPATRPPAADTVSPRHRRPGR